MLPIPSSVVKKLEAASSSFIFRSRPERLKLAELQNSVERGGLGLVCIATKAECLLLRQSIRVLERKEENWCHHLALWIGLPLVEHFPFLEDLEPVCHSIPPRFPLHKYILEALEEGIVREEYNPAKLGETSTKLIYKNRAQDVIPPPKVEQKHPEIGFVTCVYPRLANRILEAEPRDILFSLIHNLQPNRERLFLQNRSQDPFCPVPQCQGQVQNREHMFCTCYLVSEAWVWVRTRLLQLLRNTIGASGISSEDFLLLNFPKDSMDKELVWLLGNYCDIVHKVSIVKKRRLSAVQAAGLVRSRLLVLKNRAVIQPEIFNL